jgi:Helix-turn-helix
MRAMKPAGRASSDGQRLLKRLLSRLKRQGISQRQLAAEIGVAQSTVSGWVRGFFVPEDVHQQVLEAKYGLPKPAWPPRPVPVDARRMPPAFGEVDNADSRSRPGGRPRRSTALPMAPAPMLASCTDPAGGLSHHGRAEPLGPRWACVRSARADSSSPGIARCLPLALASPLIRHTPLRDAPTDDLVAELAARGFAFVGHPAPTRRAHVDGLAERTNCELVAELATRGFYLTTWQAVPA